MSGLRGASPALVYVAYALLSAAGYVAATISMKYYSQLGLVRAAVLIGGFLAAAVFFETVALKTERLGLILLLILGAESVLGLAASWWWLGERYTATELVGFALIVTGVALVKG